MINFMIGLLVIIILIGLVLSIFGGLIIFGLRAAVMIMAVAGAVYLLNYISSVIRGITKRG